MTSLSNRHRWIAHPAFWLGCCLLLSLAAVLYPLYVIRPFRYQGPRELGFALAVLQITPWLDISVVALALVLAVWSWSRLRHLRERTLVVVLTVAVVLCAIVSRVNIFERMFHPIERATFSPASKSKLDAAEMLIAVNVRGTARAYPIRIVSYHHIVNDVVGGVPIVATY